MVSQSYMDTISTISFWTLTIRRFTGWWVTILSQCRFLHGVWTIWFSQFLLYKKWVFNNGWKRQVWMKQFLLHGQVFEYNLFVLPPQQFPRRKTIVVTILFLRQEEITMANIEVPDYQSLACLPSGSTISLWNNRSKVYNVNEDELNRRILLPTNRGQVCFQRTKCFGSRLSQPRSTMAWHKMECHNTLMAAFANNPVGINWSFCPVWRRPCVSPLITWVRNTWLAQWKSMWWALAHKK